MSAKMTSFKVEMAAESLNEDCLRRARDLHEVLFSARPASPKRLGAAADARRTVARTVEEVIFEFAKGILRLRAFVLCCRGRIGTASAAASKVLRTGPAASCLM